MILGVTVAAAAGAAIGMILAPEKGSDLQRKIKVGASEWMHEFTGLRGVVKRNINGLTSELIDLDEHEKNSL